MSVDGDGIPTLDEAWWEPALAEDDVIDAAWRPVEVMSRHLVQHARAAPASTLQQRVLEALAVASSAMLDPENWGAPFKPMWVMDGQRSAIPADLTLEQLDLLASVLPSISHPLLRARVADVLWCFRDRSNAEWLNTAIDAYLQVPLDRNVWIRRGDDAWRRAIEIVRRRGKAERVRLVKISEALHARLLSGSIDDGFMLQDLSDMLFKVGDVDSDRREQLAKHLGGLAIAAADRGDYRFSRHIEHQVQKWLRSIDDLQGANESVERVARLYLREADGRLANGDDGAAMAAGMFLEKAIGTFRTLPRRYRAAKGLDSLLREIRGRLAENREATLEAMLRIDTEPIDLSDAIADTRRRLSGLSRFEALVRLAASWPLSDPVRDRALAEELAEGSIRHLFGGATYASDGRKVAVTEGGIEQLEAALWSDMIRGAVMARGVAATAFIIPGHGVVTFEHRYDLPFLRRLCIDSPWVPAGHEDLWARGLGHGLNGDFPSAVSVLVPQIEHALRQVLKAGGAYTLLVDDATGVESEKGLGSLLTMPEAKEVLGAELQYELSTLLIESQGDNLRHDTAHGLLHDGQAWSAGAVYAWWLCLRLVVVPLWNAMETRSLPSGPEAADEAPPAGQGDSNSTGDETGE
ncbi:DUF4209 domain-containing protein [Cellulomonas sp. C5510]|uniref:DUF4209 domain-containing protein n=1 Tax=Cellulomonas sp. C5510 TaxID=2871170 RepID=UPI001C9397EE|nr:DUF4209 domain-containing protein [Cellulomonas sp. C5510]QZN86220.1 DUF4209 domain-containing protein [Cellulomonas sp. C5510]